MPYLIMRLLINLKCQWIALLESSKYASCNWNFERINLAIFGSYKSKISKNYIICNYIPPMTVRAVRVIT